jgi:hypothetical protein
MLTYELECVTTRPKLTLTFLVYAQRREDAFKIGEAFLLVKGYNEGRVLKYKFKGAAPKGAKAGVAEAPPKPDYAALELRVMEWLKGTGPHVWYMMQGGVDLHQARADAEGITREQAKVLNFKDMYEPCPMKFAHFLGGHIDALPPENGNRRFMPVDVVEEDMQRKKFCEEPKRAEFKAGRGYVNLYPRGDGYVQAGNVYTTREGAQQSAKYPELVTVAHITWETAPVRPHAGEKPPGHFKLLSDSQRIHLGNRLRAWASLPDPRARMHINDSPFRPGCINISVGSSDWRRCLDNVRSWLSAQGVDHWHRQGTTTVIELRWMDLAELVWPL